MTARTMGEIFVAVRPDTAKTGAELEKDLGKVNASKAGKKVGDSFGSGFGGSIKKIAGLATGVLAGVKIKNFLAEATTGYRDHSKVAAVTNQVIKTTGKAAKVSATQVGALSDAIELKTGVDGDAIQSGANLLLTFTNVRNEAGKGNAVFSQATGLLADMSVALGQDAKGSAIQLGKALNDPITGVTALSKVGVSFTEQQKKQIKTLVDSGNTLKAQKIILGELSKEFGGAAAAAADPADRATVAYHALQDQIGSGTLPIVNALAGSFADFLAPALIDIATKHGPAVTAFLAGLAPKISASLGLLISGNFDKKVGVALGGLSEDSPYVLGIIKIRDDLIGVKGVLELLATGNYTQKIFGQTEDSKLVDGILRIREGFAGVLGTLRLLVTGNYTGKLFGQSEDSKFVDVVLRIREGLAGVYGAFKLLVTGNFTQKIFGKTEDSGLVDTLLKIREQLGKFGTSIKNADTGKLKDQFLSLVDSATKLAPVIADFIQKMPSLKDVVGGAVSVLGFLAAHTETLRKSIPFLVAGIIAYKAAQAAANVASLLAVPTKVGEVLVNRQLVKSNRELIASRVGLSVTTGIETVSEEGNTVAKSTNIASMLRQRAVTLLQAAATGIATIATNIASVATYALGVAVKFALGPVGLVIIGISLLAAGLIYAYTHSTIFRNIVNGVFKAVKDFAVGAFKVIVGAVQFVFNWVKGNWHLLLAIITGPIGIAVLLVSKNFKTIKNVVLDVIQFVWNTISGFFSDLLSGAAKAFGWVPGLGPKLKDAAKAFGTFRDSVNSKLEGLKDQKITVTAELKSYSPADLPAAHGRGMAIGGKVFGPGGPTDDLVPAMLSPTEWVINARAASLYGDTAMAAVNAGKAAILPNPAERVRGKLHDLHEAHLAHLAHEAHLSHENTLARTSPRDRVRKTIGTNVVAQVNTAPAVSFSNPAQRVRAKLHDLHVSHQSHLAHLAYLKHRAYLDTLAANQLAVGMAGGGRVGVSLAEQLPSDRGQRKFAGDLAAGAIASVRPAAQKAANALVTAGPSGPPGAVSNFRGVRLNARTIRMLLAAEHILGKVFHIAQGSYSTSVAASGGTHAGGGAMDTNGPGGWNTAVAALRKVGFASWHRLPSQGPWAEHIHSIALGDPTASQAAKNQMAAFRRGGDGLGHGMSAGGKVGTKQALAAMGIRTFDNGGLWKSGTLGANLSGRTETVLSPGEVMTVRWSDEDRRLMRAVADRPIALDSRQLDQGLARRALSGGY